MSDGAGEGLSIGKALTILVIGIEDEAYFCTSNSIIGKWIGLKLIAFGMRKSKSMLCGSHAIIIFN